MWQSIDGRTGKKKVAEDEAKWEEKNGAGSDRGRNTNSRRKDVDRGRGDGNYRGARDWRG